LKAVLQLDGGQVFEGVAVCGPAGRYTGGIVFNTSMTGFTEIITDPTSMGQILVLTYPMVGNSGVSFDDFQSGRPQIAALIVSELSEIESNFRSEDSLKAVLERFDIPIIAGVDTRSLVRLLRRGEAQTASVAIGGSAPAGDQWPPLQIRYNAARRSIKADKSIATVAVQDTGLRSDLAKAFTALGVSLEIFPYGSVPEGVFDGYILPGGPGDPADYDLAPVKAILQTNKPIFAAELGHHLLALANGARIVPLSPGHRGANIPVYVKKSNLSVITHQNHGYVVDTDSVDKAFISHTNVNDGSVEGLSWRENIISLQFQPDMEIIQDFIDLLKR
jgi:carbamoyl-phosphate synthase small subunit